MTNETQFLKGGEVAKILSVSRALAYSWMARGILPVFRVPGSRSVRVPKAALDKWIKNQTEDPGPADAARG